MSRDLDAFAGQIVMLVKTANVPVLERLATVEALLKQLGDVRDRLIALETKTDQPLPVPPPPPELPAIPDVAPIVERLATVETFLKSLDGLRDRVVAIETKAAQPLPAAPEPIQPPDLTPLIERMAAAEARMAVLGDVRDRVVAVESKSMQPVLPSSDAGLDDLKDRLKTLETRAEGPSLAEMGLVDVRKALSDLQAELRFEVRENVTLRERIAVLESRPPAPGPPGEPGPAGKDGRDGDPGKPGLSYEGVYQDGKAYDVGQLVTWGGSSWHCNEATDTKPGDGSKAWTLMVKRGRDGKDGRDAVTVPVVSVGGRS